MPRWLKLNNAAAYSAIGKKRLIALAESGVIRGFRDPDSLRGDWIFDRLSLDASGGEITGHGRTVSLQR